jgi:PadR family transcriptional regulator AphA
MLLSPTAYVVLGMIRLGRTNGYEIKQLVDASTRLFWAASYGQIYPELKRLEEDGLIVGEDDPAGGRQRRSYRLTADGEEALHDWLASDAPLTREVRDEGLLRLFFADALSPREAVEHLRRMRRQHEEIVAGLEEIEPEAAEAEAEARFPLMTARYGLDLNRWIIDWCSARERELTEQVATDVQEAR